MRKYVVLTITLLLFVGIVFVVNTYIVQNQKSFAKIVHIDVGQGESLFIRTQDGSTILLDTGPDSSAASYLVTHETNIQNIDLVIISHPDNDHIGGLKTIEKTFHVSHIMTNDDGYRFLKDKGHDMSNVSIAGAGTHLLVDDFVLEVLWPYLPYTRNDTNSNSLSVLARCGSMSLLFMGDTPQYAEQVLLQDRRIFNTKMLVIGHHGSKFSSSFNFIESVSPEYVLIGVGKQNMYHHPHERVTKLVHSLNSQVFRTDEQGTSVFYTDCSKIWQ